MVNDELLDEEKERQIEEAWAQYNALTIPPRSIIKRSWLKTHYNNQEGICPYCKGQMIIESRGSRGPEDEDGWPYATLDHIIPRSEGGPDTFENTCAACSGCNSVKGSLSPDLFLAWCEYAIDKYDNIVQRRQYLRLESLAEAHRLKTTYEQLQA